MRPKKYFFCAACVLFMSSVCNAAEPKAMSIRDYQEQALRGNHELKEAALESEAAAQAKSGAFTKYFPKLVAGAGVANTNVLPGLSSPIEMLPLTKDSNGAAVAMLTATQPIYAGGRIVNGNRLAATGKNAASQQLNMKLNEVLAESERKYRQLGILNGKMQTLQAYEKMLDALDAQVAQAFELGIASKTDRLRVKLKKDEVLVKKMQLRKMLEVAEKDLKIYAGIPVGETVLLKEDDEAVNPPALSSDTLRDSLAARPEYKLLETGVEAARLQKKMKLGGYLPSFAVGASVYQADYFKHNNFNTASVYRDTIAFGMMSIPLSDWWEASHTVKEMELKENAAREKFSAMSEYLLLDMENKLKKHETAYDQVLLAQIGLDEALANRSEREDGYKNGTEKLSDYLESLALELDSRNKLAEARAEYFQTRTAFLLATGQLNFPAAAN